MYLTSEHRVAILLHDGVQGGYGKTGLALLRYSQAPVVAVIDRQCAGKSLTELTGIPRQAPIVASVAEALSFEPNVLAIGIAPSGGVLPEAWRQEVKQGVAAGLSVVNGLHTPLMSDLELQSRLKQGQWIWDVRQEPPGLTVGSGQARLLSCLRVLTVGTDMSVGKMAASLELHRASLKRGWRSKFLASGQTGLMLEGDGVSLDAVRVDFATGAVEQMMMQFGPNHDILHIEGQGSLLNPASTATLPLLRGAQPTHLILVHRAGQTQIQRFTHVTVPPLQKVIQVYESVAAAGGAFPNTQVAAIALHTAHLDPQAAQQAIEQVQTETGLPCTDPVRFGADPLLDAILSNVELNQNSG